MLVVANNGEDPDERHESTCLAGAWRLRPHLLQLTLNVQVSGYGCGKLHLTRHKVDEPEPLGEVLVEVLIHLELVYRDGNVVDLLNVRLQRREVLYLVVLERIW